MQERVVFWLNKQHDNKIYLVTLAKSYQAKICTYMYVYILQKIKNYCVSEDKKRENGFRTDINLVWKSGSRTFHFFPTGREG